MNYLDKNKIKQKAKNLTKYSNNPYEICEIKGYVVNTIAMPIRLKGYTATKNRIKFIYINSLLDEEERKFTCAHELGHIVCGHNENVIFTSSTTFQVTNKHENEANLFAVALLLNNYDKEVLESLTTNQISQLTKIKKEYLYLFFNI